MKVKSNFSLFRPLKIKNSLSIRLLSYILICSTALAIVITLIQLLWDFQQDVGKIEQSIDQIESSFLHPMAASLWNLDEEQIHIQVEGIMNLSNMQYVLIHEVLGSSESPLIEQGTLKEKFDISKKFDLTYQGEVVGTLFVAASLDEVYDRLIEKSLLILVSQTIKTMVVSICILFIIYYMVIRHINRIALYTRNIKLSSHYEDLTLEGRSRQISSASDELDELVYLLNKMQKRIVAELTDKETAIEELQQERDFSATIINSSSTVICCLDRDFRIATINPAAVILTGYSQEELNRENWLDIFVLPDRREELLEKLVQNESIQSLEIEMHDQMGGVNTLLWTFSAFYEGMKIKYLIGFGHDITEQKQVELEVTQLNDQLEEKVTKRTAALTDSNQQITQTLEQLKRTQQTLVESEKMASLGGLVAGVAHEINTPIGISVTAASFLQDEINHLSEKLSNNSLSRSYVENLIGRVGESNRLLNTNLKRAADLISSFKQVAVDQSSEACYSFKLEENVNQVVTSLKHKLKQTRCNVFIDCPEALSIYSFPGSFAQIYSNLILNSLIHGFEDWEGKREIYINIQLRDKTLQIDYRDTGKGIPDDIAMRIFDPFVTSKRGSGGSGLGTHIVYNIVNQLFKGDIQYISEAMGTHFKLTIPYKESFDS
ncbi:sensor histidine kinase [Psychromonas marina]|uniref:histidine kinase n=1 Tax=Psychromonas marina TaxID=88364 RepID=A0ABQ6E007_9GAMM|nr:ATP-binding protein [Psychromonas marina]GLS90696.1 sensor histidine kinase [Psychromonas marina]